MDIKKEQIPPKNYHAQNIRMDDVRHPKHFIVQEINLSIVLTNVSPRLWFVSTWIYLAWQDRLLLPAVPKTEWRKEINSHLGHGLHGCRHWLDELRAGPRKFNCSVLNGKFKNYAKTRWLDLIILNFGSFFCHFNSSQPLQSFLLFPFTLNLPTEWFLPSEWPRRWGPVPPAPFKHATVASSSKTNIFNSSLRKGLGPGILVDVIVVMKFITYCPHRLESLWAHQPPRLNNSHVVKSDKSRLLEFRTRTLNIVNATRSHYDHSEPP